MPRKPHRRASSGPTPAETGSTPGATGSRQDPAPRRAAAAAEPDLPVKAAEDDPRVWGDGPDDRDSWLLEQRPPHWD